MSVLIAMCTINCRIFLCIKFLLDSKHPRLNSTIQEYSGFKFGYRIISVVITLCVVES